MPKPSSFKKTRYHLSLLNRHLNSDTFRGFLVKAKLIEKLAVILLNLIGSALCHRFGGLLVQFHPNLLESLEPQLSSPRLAVRKRAIICLGYLVMSCDQILYIKVHTLPLQTRIRSVLDPDQTCLTVPGSIGTSRYRTYGNYVYLCCLPIYFIG